MYNFLLELSNDPMEFLNYKCTVTGIGFSFRPGEMFVGEVADMDNTKRHLRNNTGHK